MGADFNRGKPDDEEDYLVSGEQFAGDVEAEEHENFEQGEPLDGEGDTTYNKEEVSPNEACYIDVEAIEANTLTPFNDSMAKLRSLTYKEKSKVINGKSFALWDPQVHEKLKYYQLNQLKDEASEASEVMVL